MPESLCIPEFRLENGRVLFDVPVVYQTWGALNDAGDNVVVICHALTGDTDVEAWWGPLLGPGAVFDTDRFFVVCANVPGSPYGTVSPLTVNPETRKPYGPDFPVVTIRDTVALHKQVLDHLGVNQVAVAAGGSMGAMQVLEWAFYGDYVQALIPLAVGGRHSAWCIGWSEAQRQAVYADPKWQGGAYDPSDPPTAGLAAARMMAMVSYRSRRSFETRFGREVMPGGGEEPFAIESYLRYQGEKLVNRFDANCYVRLTQTMDTHDVARGRGPYEKVLRSIKQPALVVGFDSDVLYPVEEQRELAEHIPDAELHVVECLHGHDSFLIEFERLDAIIRPWMESNLEKYGSPAAAGAYL
ncbi:MAG TPA: homoserine O-acetyltransferase [Rhodothermales bacterium]|nr:homoserine O-acetyltransferase [Rhodothermales bacterium]